MTTPKLLSLGVLTAIVFVGFVLNFFSELFGFLGPLLVMTGLFVFWFANTRELPSGKWSQAFSKRQDIAISLLSFCYLATMAFWPRPMHPSGALTIALDIFFALAVALIIGESWWHWHRSRNLSGEQAKLF